SVSFTGASASSAWPRDRSTLCPTHPHESPGRIRPPGLPRTRARHEHEFRLPLYEMPHVASPAQSLFAHIVFSSGGRQAQLLNKSCREDAAHGSYVCAADYEFAAPVDSLDVECTFHAVTVPNHVHLLRVENGGKHDQALFDISFPRATLRFRPPTAL